MMRAWRDKHLGTVHYVVPERTGEMDFQPGYFQQESDPEQRKNASSRNFMSDYRRRIVGRIHTYFLERGNTRGNSAPAGDPTLIEQLVESLIPDFAISLVTSFPPYLLTRKDRSENIAAVDQLSSGEAQLLTLALDVLTISSIWEIQDRKERIILIDEPDAHLHPDLLVRLAEFIVDVTDRFSLQIVIATHSTALLAAIGQFGGQRTSVIHMRRDQSEYKAREFDAVTKELASCLGGHILMGPIFGAPLLLVEGDDDYRIWSQVPRHHITNFAVIPCNGDEIKRYQKTLEGIFTCLQDWPKSPLGFALLDGDAALPDDCHNNPQNYIRFIRLNCHEAENLYLTDEVLELLETGWDEARNKIVENSVSYGNKCQRLSGACNWDRRNEDIKDVISEIADILDDKGILWTVRIGTAIGRKRPTGTLASFLGESVVEALWPKQIVN